MRLLGLALASFLTACTVPAEGPDEEATSKSTSALTGEQVYSIANMYNVGVANGFALSFASVNDAYNAGIAFDQMRQFWPGGPIVGGARGAAITTDGMPLPSFDELGLVRPTNYTMALSNLGVVETTFSRRTAYSYIFSLGSMLSSAEMQAQFAAWAPAGSDTRKRSMGYARDIMEKARFTFGKLCGLNYDGTVATPVDLAEANGLSGELYDDWIQPQDAHDRLLLLRYRTGGVLSNPSLLMSGNTGWNCHW